MGTEAAWVPLVISALGTGATAYSAREQAKDADQVAAQGIRQQASRQREADEQVSAEVGALEKSSPEAARQQATEAFMGQLRRTRGQAVSGGPTGASSGRYNADLDEAGSDVQNFGSKVASTMARINAPGLQRQAEGQGFARLASNLSTVGRNSGGDAFLNQLRLRGVGKNPWLEGGGQILTGVGNGMAASGYGMDKGLDPEGVARVTRNGYRVPDVVMHGNEGFA
jgi:hypothetical protein